MAIDHQATTVRAVTADLKLVKTLFEDGAREPLFYYKALFGLIYRLAACRAYQEADEIFALIPRTYITSDLRAELESDAYYADLMFEIATFYVQDGIVQDVAQTGDYRPTQPPAQA